jgi:hypothetical protein
MVGSGLISDQEFKPLSRKGEYFTSAMYDREPEFFSIVDSIDTTIPSFAVCPFSVSLTQ